MKELNNVRVPLAVPPAQVVSLASTVPPPRKFRDPLWLVQQAWSVVRLKRLQQLIALTISELEALAPGELLGRELSVLERSDDSPVAEALTACCEELREAAGLPASDSIQSAHGNALRRHLEQRPSAWSEAFTEALKKYQCAASRSLESIFAREAATVA